MALTSNSPRRSSFVGEAKLTRAEQPVRLKSFRPRWALLAVLGFTVLATFAARAGDAPREPDSYRESDYRAPTPLTLKGARVLTTDEAAAMWRAGDAAFIDVLPQAPRPKNLPADVVWRDKPRSDIPGSLWLPDTGYGELAPVMLDYFRRGLDKALASRARPLVFYCLKDCWMSWNAAKRALALGYSDVAWYPEGSDGWAAAALPVEKRTPEPRP
jgi:PQQ-dependent catabolism-associated CXXCW motif protein